MAAARLLREAYRVLKKGGVLVLTTPNVLNMKSRLRYFMSIPEAAQLVLQAAVMGKGIGDHPVFGVGTGGFSKAYAEKIKGTGMLPTTNPHNQYLLIATDLGLLGLGVLLYLFYRQWRLAACLFNPLLLDHTEGLLYGWMSGLLYAGLKPAPTPFLPRSRGEGENFVPSPAVRGRVREGAK